MQFKTKEVTAITGVTRDKLNKSIKMGVFSPSIKVGPGRGPSSHLFSREDLYIIKAFDKIADRQTGWYREPAAAFIKSIDRKELKTLVQIAMGVGDAETFQAKIANALFNCRLSELIQNFENLTPEKRNEIKRAMNPDWEQLTVNLIFTRSKNGKVRCNTIIEGGPDSIQALNAFRLNDLRSLMHDSEDAYILDMSKIMAQIDIKLGKYFPGEMEKESEKAHKRIAKEILDEYDKKE